MNPKQEKRFWSADQKRFVYSLNNPFGIVFSTMLITLISKGSTYMKSAAGVDAEIASVITGIILLFSACNAYIKWKMERNRREKTNKTKEDK